jgi:hypothetical protein
LGKEALEVSLLKPHLDRLSKAAQAGASDMFSITTQTCRSFTLAEVLIMAAMNVETIRPTSATRALAKTAATQQR